ncbi:MAG: DNA photolyase family protein [Flavobacteriales bacterium]|nr:DNA photolyase family protein [Flavobacteriales bacterium]
MSSRQINILWLRRDLRLEDNAAAYHALRSSRPVLVIFIFDQNILDVLENRSDTRLHFIHEALKKIKAQLDSMNSSLVTIYDTPISAWKTLLSTYDIAEVFANRDYEPYARQRDQEVHAFLKSNNITFHGYKDQVIFDRDEILKEDGKPYTIYTPYSKKWKQKLNAFYLKSYPSEKYFDNLVKGIPGRWHSHEELGFTTPQFDLYPSSAFNTKVMINYDKTRDIPAIAGTSRLSLHLRFGTVSIRKLAALALKTNEKFLNELIWRDFYQMILYHFPHTPEQAFKPAYDKIVWENDEKLFARWCEGTTGYPIVDAGMRELNATGHMHNRVRMIVASFLTKNLLIDWRWGERYFAEKLLDFDLASNVGGWQWAAGCGCDAAPYFRIFNPISQAEKFDPDEKYQRQWIPELHTKNYPAPIVDIKSSRERCLRVFKEALKNE